jgi:hypothetical protein
MKPEEGLLHDFLGELVVSQVTPRKAEKNRRVPFEQSAKCLVVPVDVGFH